MRIVALSILVFVAAGCSCRPEPRPGDACDGGDQCTDSQSALNCEDGVFVRSFCDAGCSGAGLCDYSNNAAGDPCVDPSRGTPSQELGLGNTRQCRDLLTHATLDCASSPCPGAASLTCGDGELREIPCRGASGCLSGSIGYQCDTTLAAEGENCRFTDDGKGVCDVDGGQLLQCARGKWAPVAKCPGGCTIGSAGLTCAAANPGACFRPSNDGYQTVGLFLNGSNFRLEIVCPDKFTDGGLPGLETCGPQNATCQEFTCECPSGRKFDARLCQKDQCADRATTCTNALEYLTREGEC